MAQSLGSQSRDPSPPAGSTAGGSQHPPTNVRARVTVVCQECKRLKLKCDRRIPCSSCVKRSTVQKCEYSQEAAGKVDLQSIHNQQLSHANQIHSIYDAIGVPPDERDRVANTRDIPSDFNLRFDPAVMRARLFAGIDVSALLSSMGAGDGGRSRAKSPTKPRHQAMVAFPATSPTAWSGRSGDFFSMEDQQSLRGDSGYQSHNGKGKGKSSEHGSAEEGTARLRAQLDLASRVFGANSSLVALRDSLGLWMKALGWNVEADVTSAVDMAEDGVMRARDLIESDEDYQHGDERDDSVRLPSRRTPRDQSRRSGKVLTLLASNNELRSQEQALSHRRQNALALQLAYQLFVSPPSSYSLSTTLASPTTSPFQITNGFSSFHMSPTTASPATFSSTASSSGPQRSSPLISPHHILSHLPSRPLRDTLWEEFRGVMELHSSVSFKTIGDRVDAMFAWAESAGGSTDDLNEDALSSISSSSHGQQARSIGQRTSRRPARMTLSSAPTLSFYALACASFALGAQAHSCKLAHGFEAAADGEREDTYMAGSGLPAPTSIPQPSLPPNLTPHHLHSLSRAALLAHKQLDMPPCLDTVLAYVLGWLFQMHASDEPNSHDGGARTAILDSVCRDVGEMVVLARIMGLDRSEDSGGEDNDSGMGAWEKEMRKRVWWELKCWDIYIADAMGRPPLIDDSLYPSALPVDVNDWRFNPASTDTGSNPPLADGKLGQNVTHFIMRCQLVQLEKDLIDLLSHGALSPEDAGNFEDRITQWSTSSIPETFHIDFRSTLSATIFPPSGIAAAQACDIHIKLHCLLIKLWLPLMMSSADLSSPSSRHMADSCATSANYIVIASVHALQQSRTVRPVRFRSHSFVQSMFLAATVLGSVLIEAPHVLYAETARQNLDMAIEVIFKDVVVSGKTPTLPFAYESSPRTEVLWLLELIRRAATMANARNTTATGNKRKADDASPLVETANVMEGFRVPFVGGQVTATPGDLELMCAPSRGRRRERPTATDRSDDAGSSLRRPARIQQSSVAPTRSVPVGGVGKQEEVSVSDANNAGDANGSGGRTRRKTSEYVLGAQGEYIPPSASTSHPPPAPSSGAGRSTGVVRRHSRAGSAGSSHIARPTGSVTSQAKMPVIGIRDRIKVGGTSVGRARKTREEEGVMSGEGSTGRPRVSTAGKVTKRRSFTNQQSAAVSPSGLDTPMTSSPMEYQHSFHTEPRPPSVVTNPMPGPIQQTAAPQPTYYQPPQGHISADSSYGGVHHAHSQSMGGSSSSAQQQASYAQQQQQGGVYPHQAPQPSQSSYRHDDHHRQTLPQQDIRPHLNYQPPQPAGLPPPHYPAAAVPSSAVQHQYPMSSSVVQQSTFDMREYVNTGGGGGENIGSGVFVLAAAENGLAGYDGGSSTVGGSEYASVPAPSHMQYSDSSSAQALLSNGANGGGASYMDQSMDPYASLMNVPSPQHQPHQHIEHQLTGQHQHQYRAYGGPQAQYASSGDVTMQNGWTGAVETVQTNGVQQQAWTNPMVQFSG